MVLWQLAYLVLTFNQLNQCLKLVRFCLTLEERKFSLFLIIEYCVEFITGRIKIILLNSHKLAFDDSCIGSIANYQFHLIYYQFSPCVILILQLNQALQNQGRIKMGFNQLIDYIGLCIMETRVVKTYRSCRPIYPQYVRSIQRARTSAEYISCIHSFLYILITIQILFDHKSNHWFIVNKDDFYKILVEF